MESAKELMEKKLRLRDILVMHDVAAFREFVENNKEDMNELLDSAEKVNDVLNLSLEELSEFMFMVKSQQLYLGEACQQARNHLRRKRFIEKAQESPELVGPILKMILEETGELPSCGTCQYFREAPENEQDSCMKTGKCLSADSACIGWKPLKN